MRLLKCHIYFQAIFRAIYFVLDFVGCTWLEVGSWVVRTSLCLPFIICALLPRQAPSYFRANCETYTYMYMYIKCFYFEYFQFVFMFSVCA